MTTRRRDGLAFDAGSQALINGAWRRHVSLDVCAIDVEPVLSPSSMIMVRDAVRAGVGVGRLPISLVRHDLAAGTLVPWSDIESATIAL